MWIIVRNINEMDYTTKWIISSILIILGLLIAFFGKKIFRVVLFLITLYAVGQFSRDIFSKFMTDINIVSYISLGIALVVAILAVIFYKLSFVFLGGAAGYIIGKLIVLCIQINRQWYSLGVLIVFILAGVVISYYFAKFLIITTTSFIGSNIVFSGLGTGLTAELFTSYGNTYGITYVNANVIGWLFWGMFAGSILLFLIASKKIIYSLNTGGTQLDDFTQGIVRSFTCRKSIRTINNNNIENILILI